MKTKGNLLATGALIGIAFLVVLIIAMIPVQKDTIESAKESVLECNAAATPILDTTYDLCTNASGVAVINATPTEAGLTSGEETLLLLIPLLFVLAVGYFVAKKAGLL